MKLYLASKSPRRRELLHQLGIEFEVLPTQIDERPHVNETARAFVARMASEKAHAGERYLRERGLAVGPVLGADTEVVLDEEILGKPANAEAARTMLARLSGRTHEVVTAIALVYRDEERAALSESRVTFAPLSAVGIAQYVATGEAVDKAGAYAIQGRAASFVAHIAGSYSGVMGLPLYEFAQVWRGIAADGEQR